METSEESLEDTKQIIKSILIPYSDGASLKKLCNDYEELEGKQLPYKEFGFSCLTTFLKSIKDTIRIDGDPSTPSSVVLFAVEDESTAHIVEMVAQQNNKKKGSKRKSTRNHSFNRNHSMTNLKICDKSDPRLSSTPKRVCYSKPPLFSTPISHLEGENISNNISNGFDNRNTSVSETITRHKSEPTFCQNFVQQPESPVIENISKYIKDIKSLASPTPSSPFSLSNGFSTPKVHTLSDWIRHKKSDLKPESVIKGFQAQAQQSIDDNNFEDAIDYYTKAIGIDSNLYTLYSNRAYCYQMLDNWELCLIDAQKAIDLREIKFNPRKKSEDKDCEILNTFKCGNKLNFYRKGLALKAMNRLEEAMNALIDAKNCPISCDFINDVIKEINFKHITDLGFDPNEAQDLCQSTENVIKQIIKNKEKMMCNDLEVIPTNPFKHRGLYVNGLAPDCGEKTLEECLTECGEILRLKIYSNDVQSRAIISFSDPKSVCKAVQILRKNKQLVRKDNDLIFRFKHSILDKEPDLQIDFKGDEIVGECYKWRTSGCVNTECKALHIPICHHLDQRSVETEANGLKKAKQPEPAVKGKRIAITFDISISVEKTNESETDINSEIKKLGRDIITKLNKSEISENNNSISNGNNPNRSLTSYDDLF